MSDNLRSLESTHHPNLRLPDGARSGFRMDLTINIPTIITLVTLATGVISFGVTTYNDLNRADVEQKRDISMLRTDVDRISAAQANVAVEMRQATDKNREENRQDFREVRASLDKLNDRLQPAANNAMRGWTK
ncbi:hypothetical protein [Pseudomonas aeruginosa]|uniref:hypothetical protein n=1 Tax=Pseudomonas aeruginosa TaxID=287 RepID=UPI001CF0B144|nr:hypothetical protein [Pseudomonas aeruginosa]